MIIMLRALIMLAALQSAGLASTSATAAELSIEQVRATLRAASPSMPANLAGKDLSDLDMSGLDFRNADLRGASFFGSKLVQADMRGAMLEGANLNGSWLMGTDFTGANLNRASLLSVVILGGSVKTVPIFKNAQMRGAKIIADLPGADLSGADFTSAMVGVNIKNQGMGQMRTVLSNANLVGAVLIDADFNRAEMSFCNLRGADLRGANFFRVKLGGADLTGADVTGADFSEADVEGTVFQDTKGFAEAKGLGLAKNAGRLIR